VLGEINKKINIYVQMILTLSLLSVVNIFYNGFYNQGQHLVIAVIAAVILDLAINYLKYKRKVIPYTAIITGMILGLVLESETFWLHIFAVIVAIFSKHYVNIKNRHVFNPANLGILLSVLIFPQFGIHSWWGSNNLIAVLVTGLLIVWRMQRFEMVGIFLFGYLLLVLPSSLQISNIQNSLVAELGGPTLFFTFVMLIEPKSSPISRKGRLVFGFLVAVFSAIFRIYMPAHALLAPLVLGNLCVPLINMRFK